VTNKRVCSAALVCYLALIAFVTVMPTHALHWRPRAPGIYLNLVPLVRSWRCAVPDPRLMMFCLRNSIGNFLLFVPLGLLFPLTDFRFRRFRRLFLTVLAMSIAIETAQFLLSFLNNPRSADIDDVILNTLGACAGFVIYRFVSSQRTMKMSTEQ
jgi:glycopeptide antibiotics resistance protein